MNLVHWLILGLWSNMERKEPGALVHPGSRGSQKGSARHLLGLMGHHFTWPGVPETFQLFTKHVFSSWAHTQQGYISQPPLQARGTT